MSARVQPAIVLAGGLFGSLHGKVAHGLVRGGTRFRVLAVVDPPLAGRDAGEALDGRRRGIPVVASLAQALALGPPGPEVCVVGVATHGGRFTADLRGQILAALEAGLGVVNGLHECVTDDPELREAAARTGAPIEDLRRPRPARELRFWSGEVRSLRTPRLAVLGTDCAVGKRTTARLLVEALRSSGIAAEMIYTGQTGWMQGARFGVILDAVINDFVSGELERAILECAAVARPDVMVLEGQSALRNPSGPCGAELLLSAGARGVILQHAPGRAFFDGFEDAGLRIPPLKEELELIRLYGARVLAVTLHPGALGKADLAAAQSDLGRRLGVPVVRPLDQGMQAVLPAVRAFLDDERR